MTPDQDTATIPTVEQEWPADPRPAWERIAYAWLAREVDAGQPVDPATLAREVSVAPGLARDLVRVLRAERDRDPALEELRGRLVRDRITDAYLTRELPGGPPLDPVELARDVGTTSTVARQWLHILRVGQQTDPRLASLRAEPASHGRPTHEQLQALQGAYAGGGRPQPDQAASAERALERIEQLYQAREVPRGQYLDPAAVARLVGVREGRVRQVLGPLRTAHRNAAETDRTSGPVAVIKDDGRQAWLDQAACRDTDPERFFPEPGEQTKAAEAKAICGGCQVRDRCLELAITAAGGLDHDHGVFGGTLPAERSRLRGNRFPEPSVYREHRELAEQAHQLASQVGVRQAARQLGVHREALKAAFAQWQLAMPERRVGWQPTRFLTDRAEAERAYALAEQLGSVNAAAAELDTTWPSLRKAFTRHGLGMPARNPQAVRQWAIPAARQRSGRPATPSLDPVFVALNPGALPARERSPAELFQWVRRDEEYAILGANVVVELNSESRVRQPTSRAWAIIRRADRAQRLAADRERRVGRRVDRTVRSRAREDRGLAADGR